MNQTNQLYCDSSTQFNLNALLHYVLSCTTRNGGHTTCGVEKVRSSKVELERQVVQVAEHTDIEIGCSSSAINMSSSCFISFRRLITLTRLLPFSNSHSECLRQFIVMTQHSICNPFQIQKNGSITRWFRVLREKNRCIPFNSVTVVSKFA